MYLTESLGKKEDQLLGGQYWFYYNTTQKAVIFQILLLKYCDTSLAHMALSPKLCIGSLSICFDKSMSGITPNKGTL